MRVLSRPGGAGEVVLRRFADPVYEPDGEGAVHMAVPEDTRDPGQLELADVVMRYGAPDDPRLGSPAAWCAEVLRQHTQCALAAYVTGRDDCTVLTRDGEVLVLSAAPQAADADPGAYASALYAWLAAGNTAQALVEDGLLVRTGGTGHRLKADRLKD